MEAPLYFKIIGWIIVAYILIGDVIATIEIILDGIKSGWRFNRNIPSDEVYGNSYIVLSMIWPIVIIERIKKAYGKAKN